MAIQIKTVSSKAEMKIFARFGNKLYKGNRYYVPSMPMDDMNTFDKEKNGAFDFSEPLKILLKILIEVLFQTIQTIFFRVY